MGVWLCPDVECPCAIILEKGERCPTCNAEAKEFGWDDFGKHQVAKTEREKARARTRPETLDILRALCANPAILSMALLVGALIIMYVLLSIVLVNPWMGVIATFLIFFGFALTYGIRKRR